MSVALSVVGSWIDPRGGARRSIVVGPSASVGIVVVAVGVGASSAVAHRFWLAARLVPLPVSVTYRVVGVILQSFVGSLEGAFTCSTCGFLRFSELVRLSSLDWPDLREAVAGVTRTSPLS